MLRIGELSFQTLQFVFEISVHRTAVQLVVFHLSDDLLKFRFALAQQNLHS